MSKSAQKKKKAKQVRKIKKGQLFERAVADVFRQFDRSAKISSGEWVAGPDGRRELDVLVELALDGTSVRGIVECKDFDPATTGPVGVGYVDALESKRRDLAAAFSMICSNAGFTADAIRKARRVGIGLISAARKGDERIRFGIVEEIYVRHIRISRLQIRVWPTAEVAQQPKIEAHDSLTFQGRPICRWFHQRLVYMLGLNPIVKGSFQDFCTLKAPIDLHLPGGVIGVNRIGMEIEVEGAWFKQTVRINATNGIYDWLRRCLKVAPGSGQVEYEGVNPYGGEWISRPEDVNWQQGFQPHDFGMRFIMLKNSLDLEDGPALDSFVMPEDLKLVMDGIPPELTESVPGFSSAKVSKDTMDGLTPL